MAGVRSGFWSKSSVNEMSRSSAEVAEAIDGFQPRDGEWLELDALLEELFHSDSPSSGINALLRVFQRFPTDDGAGVFWGIVHGLESLSDYEERLVESVIEQPSEFGIIMLHRLRNSGTTEVRGINLHAIFEATARNELLADGVRSRARRLIGHGSDN